MFCQLVFLDIVSRYIAKSNLKAYSLIKKKIYSKYIQDDPNSDVQKKEIRHTWGIFKNTPCMFLGFSYVTSYDFLRIWGRSS